MSERPDFIEPEGVGGHGARRIDGKWIDCTCSDCVWLAEEAKRREEIHGQFKVIAAQERRVKREAMSLDARLREVAIRIGRLFPNPANAIGKSSPSSDAVRLPNVGDQFELAHLKRNEVAMLFKLAFNTNEPVARKAIEKLEQAVDVHLGLAPVTSHAQMIGAEKDARILKLYSEGLTPDQISDLEPHLGDRKVIRKVIDMAREAA